MLALVVLSVIASFEATQSLGVAFQYLESTEKAAENLHSLVSVKSAEKQQKRKNRGTKPESKKYSQVKQSEFTGLSFDSISFSYGHNKVLKNVGFTVESGEKIALVGPSGCGKSTIANLVLKFYEPDMGNVFIGKRKLSDIAPGDVRFMISVVDQSTYLFQDTLRNNLILAREDADDKKLLESLQQAHLWTWYQELENGLDTVPGEHGK